MKPLLIATRNKGKFKEIFKKLEDLPCNLLGLDDVKEIPFDYDVDETAMSFEGNAIIKAMIMGKKSGLLTLSDDAGLEVDAMGGQPGIYSSRYAPGSDQDRYEKLIKALTNVSDDNLGAQFRCIIAVYDPAKDKIKTYEGIYRGRIVREPKGDGGFGYDPIFYDEQLGKTLAEATMEEKLSLSHRGIALGKAYPDLKNEFL